MVKDGSRPAAVTHGSMLDAWAGEKNELKRAEFSLREMEGQRIPPNHFSYNSMIQACVQKGQVAEVGRLGGMQSRGTR